MKSIINIFKLGIKWGALIMAVIKIIEFAVEQFETIDLSKDESKTK